MRILFFFVHPSKFHLFKHAITRLRSEGCEVDVAIVTKDILEELVKGAGWQYTNIFPEGRRNPGLPVLLGTLINLMKTVWRLYRFTRGKKYDLFITDDCLSIIGRVRGVPSFHFQDDDLKAVPESALLLMAATKIVSPQCCDLGWWNRKKISYKGNHEFAYLDPRYYTPDPEVIKSFNPSGEDYFIVRLVSLTASHDRNKKGLDDAKMKRLVNLLQTKGRVFITSERALPGYLEPYRIRINPLKIADALNYACMFIGDSQTMTSEAAVLGTPAIRYNDFAGKISYLEEEEREYGLTFGFRTEEFEKMLQKIEELLAMPRLKEEWQKRREKLLSDYIDVTGMIVHLIKNHKNYIS